MPADHRVTPRASRDVAVEAIAVLTKEVAALRAEVRELRDARQPTTDLPAPQRVVEALRRRLRRN